MVTIYKRKDGRIYLHTDEMTSMGMPIACAPFVKIEPEEIQRLPSAVSDLLLVEPKIVPYPKDFDQLEPMYAMAGCRSWRAFVAGAVCFLVVFEEGVTELIRTRREGRGFAHLPDRISLDEAGGLEILPSLLSEPQE